MSLWDPATATARARPEFKAQKKGPEMKYSSKVYNQWRRWSTGEEAQAEGERPRSGKSRGSELGNALGEGAAGVEERETGRGAMEKTAVHYSDARMYSGNPQLVNWKIHGMPCVF